MRKAIQALGFSAATRMSNPSPATLSDHWVGNWRPATSLRAKGVRLMSWRDKLRLLPSGLIQVPLR